MLPYVFVTMHSGVLGGDKQVEQGKIQNIRNCSENVSEVYIGCGNPFVNEICLNLLYRRFFKS